MENLAGKTYEVQVSEGGRWLTSSVHESRSEAIGQAKIALEGSSHDAVKVIAESDRDGIEVIFEETIESKPKAVTIVPIGDAPVCRELTEFYGFEARQTLGRLMRNFLDEQGLTPLELMFSATHITLLERKGTLLNQAVQRIATIQGRKTDSKSADRVDDLYKVIAKVKERASKAARDDKLYQLLRSNGLNAVTRRAAKLASGKDEGLLSRAALARYLNDGGDWNAKLTLLRDLAKPDLAATGKTLIDEATAEILDGGKAVLELLGKQPDMATGNTMLIDLSFGHCQIPKNSITPLEEVNAMVAEFGLPLTRGVLLHRVAGQIGGTRPLTREGDAADRDAFVSLVRELVGENGLRGGPEMCEAVTLRARGVLSEEDNDLSLDEGVGRILDLIPHRAARFGYLVDLATSAIGAKDPDAFQSTLRRMFSKLTAGASFIPRGAGADTVATAVKSIKARLKGADVPGPLKKEVGGALDQLIGAKPKGTDAAASGKFTLEDGSKKMAKKSTEQTKIEGGDMIFEEGEEGEEAYLVVSGEVEIFRTSGNKEEVLATLGRGQIFGEISLIDNQPRMASARALEDTDLTVIDKSALQVRLDRLEETDRVLRRLIDILADRIRGRARIAE